MDTGRLPAYRSSYLLRYHPYPRMKLSARERVMISTFEAQNYRNAQASTTSRSGYDNLFTSKQGLHGVEIPHRVQSTQRRLDPSTLVDDLAHLFAEKLSLQDG